MTATPPTAEDVFYAAVELRDRSSGAAITETWLNHRCSGDRRLAQDVRSLLRHLDAAAGTTADSGGFLDPAELHGSRAGPLRQDAELQAWGGAAIGQRVGEFTIIGQLGAGGMGVVYVAEQERPRRTVALKVIRRALATPPIVARFEREADVLGRLAHPGIAQIYAAGVADVRTPDGGPPLRIPYIAMERVEGLAIAEYVRVRRCPPAEVVALLIQTCDAIDHAHRRGVIHRDLKPANLLVAVGERGEPVVKVLDFGVARAIDVEPLAGEDPPTRLTHHGHLVGTPAYMSPEQIVGRAHEVTAAADVYALGAILFQLLTGRHAIDLVARPLPEVARRVVELVPPRLGTLDRALRGDLDSIVAKALEKDPLQRYATAAALGEDLRRHLAGRPIDARASSLLAPCLKAIRHYRTLAAALAVSTGSLAGVAVYASHEAAARRAADAQVRTLAEELRVSRSEMAQARAVALDPTSAAPRAPK